MESYSRDGKGLFQVGGGCCGGGGGGAGQQAGWEGGGLLAGWDQVQVSMRFGVFVPGGQDIRGA